MASTMNSSELKQGLLKHDNDPMTPIKGKKHALESSETATATPTSPASDQSPMAADVRVIPIVSKSRSKPLFTSPISHISSSPPTHHSPPISHHSLRSPPLYSLTSHSLRSSPISLA
eukprot:GHVN01041613.1.p1 GENE.GHVN01041613.1~~GHVN01041613.1.p1  ORF type:complete len:117 (+),score=38.10 GHVN01041613.1:170-520(+)